MGANEKSDATFHPKPTLWHYTCDHSAQGIGREGWIKPARMLKPHGWVPALGSLVWLTDLEAAHVASLGLTQHLLTCDRTAHRYRVVDNSGCVPWIITRRMFDQELRDEIEGHGAMPMHWWVSTDPVRVVLDDWKAAAS